MGLTIAFGWPVGETLVSNINREMGTVVFHEWLEAPKVKIKPLQNSIFPA